MLDLVSESIENDDAWGAGIFGIDKLSFSGKVSPHLYELAREGWTLGYSQGEMYRVTCPGEKIVRDCRVFRQDQTLINLLLKKYCPHKVFIRSNKFMPVYIPRANNKKPFFWHTRTNVVSLYPLWKPLHRFSRNYFFNRFRFFLKALTMPMSLEILLKRV